MGLGRAGLGRCDAQQVPCDLPARRDASLSAPPPSQKTVLDGPGPVPGSWPGTCDLQPRDLLELQNGWVSFLFQGGRAVGGFLPRPDYLATALLAQAGYFFPWIWVPLVVIFWSACPELEPARDRTRAAGDLSGRRAPGCLHGRGLLPPGPAALGIDRARLAVSHAGLVLASPVHSSSGATARWLAFAAGFPILFLGLTLLEHHSGCFQRGGSLR